MARNVFGDTTTRFLASLGMTARTSSRGSVFSDQLIVCHRRLATSGHENGDLQAECRRTVGEECHSEATPRNLIGQGPKRVRRYATRFLAALGMTTRTSSR